jgi:tetratricopeptide (TPR) repeat protein
MKKILITLSFIILAVTAYCQSPAELAALDLAKQGKTPEAISAFQTIIAGDPHNVNAIMTLGQLYLREGKNQEAYDTATKGLAVEPNNDNLTIGKAKAAIAMNKDDEAITLMDVVIARNPDFFYPYIVKGNALDDENKIQLAIGAYSKSIQLKADFPMAYLSRAEDFASISRYDQAITDYDKCIEMMPDNDEAYNMRGQAKYFQNKYPEAIADYSKAIELNKEQTYAMVNRGIVYAKTGERDKAVADYNAAIAVDPNNNADPYYQLAKLYQKERNYDPAQQNIEKGLAIKGTYASASYYVVYCQILLGANKNTEGLAAAEKALALDKESSDGYLVKATAYSNLERYDDAISTINDGLKLYPDNYLFYSLRSAVYKFKGNTAQAEADNQKAKELGTKN